ncbi:MAG: hypothetical protein ACREBQ_13870, partial [Nitrososphaerales archaeon]
LRFAVVSSICFFIQIIHEFESKVRVLFMLRGRSIHPARDQELDRTVTMPGWSYSTNVDTIHEDRIEGRIMMRDAFLAVDS